MTVLDQILIDRNGVTYRANLDALSSVVLFHDSESVFLESLNDISVAIDALTSNFDEIVYSKTEMKTTFSTKETVDNLTANALYVLKDDAKTVVDKLRSKTNLDKWETNTSKAAVQNLIDGYGDAVMLVNTDVIEADKIEAYSTRPKYEQIAP